MSDKSTAEEKSQYFDEIFSGNEKPSICLDQSYLENSEHESNPRVTIDYENSEDHPEYKVRKFSTSGKSEKVVDEGQETVSCISPDIDYLPLIHAAVLGSPGVGKTSLCHQFTTSSLINMKEGQEEVMMQTELVVEVDGWRCRLNIVDFPGSFCQSLLSPDPTSSSSLDTNSMMVVLVVFAVDDRRSLERAGSLLALLRREGRLVDKVGVLVGNKADLVRSRVVLEVGGRTVAGRYEVSYVETSAGIHYNVDELLVRIVKEVNSGQGIRRKKMSMAEMVKDLVVRRRSRETNQEIDERKISRS